MDRLEWPLNLRHKPYHHEIHFRTHQLSYPTPPRPTYRTITPTSRRPWNHRPPFASHTRFYAYFHYICTTRHRRNTTQQTPPKRPPPPHNLRPILHSEQPTLPHPTTLPSHPTTNCLNGMPAHHPQNRPSTILPQHTLSPQCTRSSQKTCNNHRQSRTTQPHVRASP
jgi:hypothetical protein